MDGDEQAQLLQVWLVASILVQLEWMYQSRQPPFEDRRRWFRGRQAGTPTPTPSRRTHEEWRRLFDDELLVVTNALDISPSPPVVADHSIPNAASDGVRIRINTTWAREITQMICKRDGRCREALLRGIASHELAHHLREERFVPDRHAEELRADSWTASVLTALGTSVEPYQRLVGEGRDVVTHTHPPPSRRRRAIERGRQLELPFAELARAGARAHACSCASHPLPVHVCQGECKRTKEASMDDADELKQDIYVDEDDDEELVQPVTLPKLDEYVEDLIDPTFGSYSSRQVVRASADKMLAGFNGILADMREALTGKPPTSKPDDDVG